MWILKHGSILNKPRNYLINKSKTLKDLFNCSLCLGFWSGLIVILFYHHYINPTEYLYTFPIASCALCWFLDSLLDLIQISSCKLDKKS